MRRNEGGQLFFVNPLWGLVPSWHTGQGRSKPQINVRVETAAEKPIFRDLWRNGRCLILADGSFEWPAAQGGKAASGREPFYVSLPDHRPFLIAGLWRSPLLDKTGHGADFDNQSTAAILTTAANSDINWLHGRMPLILEEGQAKAWLEGFEPSLRTGPLVTRQMSHYVNNVAHYGPRCIETSLGLFG